MTSEEFWLKEFEDFPEAEGIDFVPVGFMPWDKNVPIWQTWTKEDLLKGVPYPRSGRFFWKKVNGKKEYIYTYKQIEAFKNEFCSKCKQWKCNETFTEIASCKMNSKEDKKMKANVAVTYSFNFEPADVGLSADCDKLEFENAVTGYMIRVFEDAEKQLGAPNDIKIKID